MSDKGGLISEGIFTLGPFPKRGAKSRPCAEILYNLLTVKGGNSNLIRAQSKNKNIKVGLSSDPNFVKIKVYSSWYEESSCNSSQITWYHESFAPYMRM